MSARKKQGRDQAGEPGREGGRASGGERSSGGLGETLRTFGGALVIFLILRTFLLQTFYITSGSMEDTMLVGDFLVVNRAVVGGRIPFTRAHFPGYGEVERGDILVFDPPHEPDLKLVKRLIGLPGDTLEMRDQVLYLNGEAQEEPYVKHVDLPDAPDPWMSWQRSYLAPGADVDTYRPTRDNWGPIVIPEDRYFMLGDNREESLDSRYWGLLEGWRLEGRVSFIYFSYDRESFKPLAWLREIRWNRIFNGVE